MINFNKFYAVLFTIGAIASQNVGAAAKTTKTPSQVVYTTNDDAGESVLHNSKEFALGINRFVTVDGISINSLHSWLGIMPKAYIGLGFGMDANFGEAVLFGDFRYDVIHKGSASLFLDGQAGWRKINLGGDHHINGFAMGMLGGFDYALTQNLHASFAYGLEFLFSDLSDHIGITNNGFEGNFGLHWFFN